MNAVQEIKQRHDMGILLRAIAPAARKRQEARRKQRWNVSAIAPGDKVYFCPRCESKHKIAEWTKISRMNGRTSNAS